jgi:hypothetical protein
MAPGFRRDMLGTLLWNFHRYGDVVAYRFGPRWGPRRLRQNVVMAHHPHGIHQVLADVDTTVSGYQVPAGTRMMLSSWVTHRHPRTLLARYRQAVALLHGKHDLSDGAVGLP